MKYPYMFHEVADFIGAMRDGTHEVPSGPGSHSLGVLGELIARYRIGYRKGDVWAPLFERKSQSTVDLVTAAGTKVEIKTAPWRWRYGYIIDVASITPTKNAEWYFCIRVVKDTQEYDYCYVSADAVTSSEVKEGQRGPYYYVPQEVAHAPQPETA